MKTFLSDISHTEFPMSDKVSGRALRPALLQLIQKDVPEFTPDHSISISELNNYREKYISSYLTKEVGELSELEKTVAASLTDKTTLTDKVNHEKKKVLTVGQKVADKVASFGGSWKFIISFGVFMFSWICVNVLLLVNKPYDPYPFILLNLILSCLAAIQAPVIMMSQNRQEEKDRDRSKKDYMVNLKAEMEVRMLHEKLDHLVMHQQQELLEIQKVQIEMLNDILKRIAPK